MLRNGIAQFVGSWISKSGYRLQIRKVRKDRAFVHFLGPRGAPIARVYMGGAPSMKMIAHYDDYNEDFRVDLWEEGKGFILHLDHEYDYVLDSGHREALVPGISRYERDRFLDAYYSSFHHFALRPPLLTANRVGVAVHGDVAVGVAHQRLHGVHILIILGKKCRKCVTTIPGPE